MVNGGVALHRTKEQERAELHRAIWQIANDLRGSVDGWDFKQYVLGILFYRFISENLTNYINADERRAGKKDFDYGTLSDKEAEFGRADTVKEKGFYILPSELFVNVRKRARNDANLNETLSAVFSNIESSAKGATSEDDLKGLFDDLDVNSNKLGGTVEKRNQKLVKLLDAIGELRLGEYADNTIDAFGDAYEFLMTMYASTAGKSGGEFFTPQEVSELLARITTVGKKEVNKVYDPACGSGSLLLKFAKVLGKDNVRLGFFGQEINLTTYNLCRINMFLHDVNYNHFDIAHGDTLTILKNTVYAGFFHTKDGERHELDERLPRAISENTYWQIQKILGDKGRPRASKNKQSFAYTGIASCGGCGGVVMAEHKYQMICDGCKIKFTRSNKRTSCPHCDKSIKRMRKATHLHYIYYHCTHIKDPSCRQGSVTELYIDNQLATYFRENLTISKDLHDWCIKNLAVLDGKDKSDDSEKKVSLQATLAQKQKEYKELVLMKTRGLIEDKEFIELKGAVRAEIDSLEAASSNSTQRKKEATQKAKRAFDLALGIEEIFTNGTSEEKKETLRELQSNLTIIDKKLNVCNTGVVQKIINGLLSAKAENPQFEPRNYGSTKGQNDVFDSVCPTLLRDLDKFRIPAWRQIVDEMRLIPSPFLDVDLVSRRAG